MTVRLTKPGIYEIDEDAYHADPCPAPSLSAGAADLVMNKTPLHAWTGSPRLNPYWEPETKREFDLGSAFHELVLGKGKGIREIKFENYRTQESKDRRDAAREMGYTPLLTHEVEQVEVMRDTFRRQLTAALEHAKMAYPFDDPTWNEVTGICKVGDVWLRAKADHLNIPARVIFDLKSAVDTDPEYWMRQSLKFGVDIRVAHYRRVFETLYPGPPFRYIFLLSEKEPPHTMSAVEIDYFTVEVGREKHERAIETWDWCLSRNVWPGRESRIVTVTAPPYHEKEWVARRDGIRAYQKKHGKDILDAWFRFQAGPGADYRGDDFIGD